MSDRPVLDLQAIERLLLEPFDPHEVKFRPGQIAGNRALALAYVDARVVMDRLDEVMGVFGWQDEYEDRPDGTVICKLRLRIGDEWITKTDIGGPSEQPDEGDRRKAAFSDALKRAAVKWGIGRFLYRLPPLWVDYDPQKKRFLQTPALPASALPNVKPVTAAKRAALAAPADPPAQARPDKTSDRELPKTGAELFGRLAQFEDKLVTDGACKKGELVSAVQAAGQKAGHGGAISTWEGPALKVGIDAAMAFIASRKKAVAVAG